MKHKIIIFFTIGIFLYLIDIGLNSESKDIYISDQEILSLVSAWKSQVGREPTDDEISRIINNLVDEEILYREALLLGLDNEDRIIKRRLAQKISFLKQESISTSPSNKEILNFYNKNKEKYFVNPSYSFTHYYFSSDNNSEDRSKVGMEQIKNNIEVNSDSFFLGKNFAAEDIQNIDSNFGKNFSSNLLDAPLNKWVGPYRSSFGHHILFITDFQPGFYLDIEDVLNQVEVDLLQIKRDKAVQDFLNKIRLEYEVIINPNLKI